MLATLILCCLVTVTFGTRSAVFKFSIRPDKVDVGAALPFAVDILNEGSNEFRNSALGLALKRKGQLHGFAVVKNVSNALALIRFDHPELNQDTLAISLKDHQNGKMKMSTDQYKLVLVHSHSTVKDLELLEHDDNSCSCVRGNCACCADIKIPEFHHDICVNATYNHEAYGLDLSIGIDGHYYTMEVSLRNPPPICLAVPFAHDLVDLCVAFKDLDVSREKHTLSGCIELEGELIHMRVIRVHLGCFVMPI